MVKGCSFCIDAGEALPIHQEIVDLILKQLHYLHGNGFTFKEFKVPGLRTLQYLDKVAEGIVREGFTGQTYLFEPRVDWMVKYKEPLERALSILQGTGNCIAFHLIGFENFSQKELDIFNKGVTVADNVKAVKLIRQWGQRFPEVFDYNKYAAHGFIMFNPWTTIHDLRLNINHIRQLHFETIRQQPWLSKLRLYPQMPLYEKAKQEGLLLESYGEAVHLNASQATGYSQETPWKFRDPKVGFVYEWTVRLLSSHADDHHHWMRKCSLPELDIFESIVEVSQQKSRQHLDPEQIERVFSYQCAMKERIRRV